MQRALLTLTALLTLAAGDAHAVVSGVRWHPTELTFTDGAETYAETSDAPNPFKDRRLTCTLTAPGGAASYVVQGFFDGDGAGGASGSKFTCRFSFPQTGTWSYQVKLCKATDAALNPSPAACALDRTADLLEPASGVVQIAPSTAQAPDFRAPERGWVRNPGGHALVFAGGGGAFVKAGVNLGDGFLGYWGFDNTEQQCSRSTVKTYATHVADWTPGDANWTCGSDCTHGDPQNAGKGIVGAINYIASGANGKFMILLNTPNGDTCNVYPYVDSDDHRNFDLSKLDQWELAFEHAQRKGLCLHLAFGEREINNLLDGGTLGVERKLLYKEMIARFGHHPCVEWNLGEEQTYWQTSGRIAEFAAYIKSVDPYDHPLAANTNITSAAITGTQNESKLAGDDIDMTSFQRTAEGYPVVWDVVQRWRDESTVNGHPWVVSLDEPRGLSISPTHPDNPIAEGRTRRMWPWVLSGGFGFEWHVLSADGTNSLDASINDFHIIPGPIAWAKHLLDTLDELDLVQMSPFPPQGTGRIATATGDASAWTLAKLGSRYLVYGPGGGSFTLNLSHASAIGKTFDVTFVDPVDGSRCAGTPVSAGSAATNLGACTCPGANACNSTDVAVLVNEQGAPTTTLPNTTTTTSPPTTTLPNTTTTAAPPTTTLPDTTTTTSAPPTTTLPNPTTTSSPPTTTLPNTTTTTAAPPTTTLPATTTTLPPSRIEIDPASTRTACGGSPANVLTIPNVPVSARPNRILVVTVGAEENDADCNLARPEVVVSYAGHALQRAVSALSDTSSWRACNGIFYLLDPPVGTANVTITLPATVGDAIDNRHAGTLLLYNAAQQPPETISSAGADSTVQTVTTNVAVATGNAWAVDVITQGDAGSFTALQAGQVERWEASCTSSSSATSTKEVASPGTTSLGWSHSSPRRYAHALATFAPAGVSTTTTSSTVPPVCDEDTDCDDADACTDDQCVAGACEHTGTCSEPIQIDPLSIRSTCNGAASDTLTLPSVPVSAFPDSTLIVVAGAEADDQDCNLAHAAVSVTYAGIPMSLAVSALSDTSSWRACSGIFYLHDPPVGTANVTITFPGNAGGPIDERHGGAFVLYNVAAGPPEATAAAGADNNANPVATSIAIATDGAWVVDALTRGNPGTFTVTQAGQVERWEQSCATASSASSTLEATAGLVPLGWQHSKPRRYAHALAAFAPARP